MPLREASADNFGIRCPLADLITSGFRVFFLMEVK